MCWLSGACDHTAGFRPSLDSGEDAGWGLLRVTGRKLLYHSAECSEWTHLHSLEMCFCNNARCLSCMCIYVISKAATTPLPFPAHPFPTATHTPEDCICVLLISISAELLSVRCTREFVRCVWMTIIGIIVGMILVWPFKCFCGVGRVSRKRVKAMQNQFRLILK